MAESKSLRIAYGEALAELGAENDKIVVLDADHDQPLFRGVSGPLF